MLAKPAVGMERGWRCSRYGRHCTGPQDGVSAPVMTSSTPGWYPGLDQSPSRYPGPDQSPSRYPGLDQSPSSCVSCAQAALEIAKL